MLVTAQESEFCTDAVTEKLLLFPTGVRINSCHAGFITHRKYGDQKSFVGITASVVSLFFSLQTIT